jgi:hypothetical protein
VTLDRRLALVAAVLAMAVIVTAALAVRIDAVRVDQTSRPAVVCHGLEQPRCGDLAQAALGAIDDPAIPRPIRVQVWGTIACGDDFDCPPRHLVGRHPAGSAVVTISPALEIWVNITELDGGAEPADVNRLDAWVTRSQPR